MRQHWKAHWCNCVVQMTVIDVRLIIFRMIWVLHGKIFAQFLAQILGYGFYQFIQPMVMDTSTELILKMKYRVERENKMMNVNLICIKKILE